MDLEKVLEMWKGTDEQGVIATGIQNTEAKGFDCDCYSSDWKRENIIDARRN